MTSDSLMRGRTKFYLITQAVLSSLGLITGLPAAFLFFVFALFSYASSTQDLMQGGVMMAYAFTLAFVALAFVPGLIITFYRLTDSPVPKIPAKWKRPLILSAIGLWLTSLLLSLLLLQWEPLSILNSIFVVPLVIIPLILIVLLGSRNLSIGNSSRTWGVVTFNFSITMPVVFAVEIILFIFLMILMAIWLNSQPQLLNQILSFSNLLSQDKIDTQAVETILTNLFKHPVVLNTSILVISFFVPLIEEFFKPMALWFLAGKKLTPQQGFVGGLIAGACFAAIETLGSVGSPVDISWYSLLFGRIGTGILHITLSGLVGWGIASAFFNGNWGRAIINYLIAVLIHGAWNLFALLSGIMPILPAQEQIASLPLLVSQISPYMLMFLGAVNLYIIIRTNQNLQFKTGQLPISNQN